MLIKVKQNRQKGNDSTIKIRSLFVLCMILIIITMILIPTSTATAAAAAASRSSRSRIRSSGMTSRCCINNNQLFFSKTIHQQQQQRQQQQRLGQYSTCFISSSSSLSSYTSVSTFSTSSTNKLPRPSSSLSSLKYVSSFPSVSLFGIRKSVLQQKHILLSSSLSSVNDDTTNVVVQQQQQQQNETIEKDQIDNNNDNNDSFFSNIDFPTLGIQSPILLQRLDKYNTKYGITNDDDNNNNNKNTNTNKILRPTWIQKECYNSIRYNTNDIIVGAETGTGKTLAYLLPIFDDILQIKKHAQLTKSKLPYDYGRVLILLPNKELIQQLVVMASVLTSDNNNNNGSIDQSLIYPRTMSSSTGTSTGTTTTTDPTDIIRMAIIPGGLKEIATDFLPFRNYFNPSSNSKINNNNAAGNTVDHSIPIDVLISTPAAIGPLALSIKNIPFFVDIKTIIMDEADMLLDGGYLRPIQDVFLGFKRADRIVKNYVPSSSSTSKESYIVNDTDNEYKNQSDFYNDELLPSTTSIKERTQYIFVAATLPDYGLRSVDAYITKKFPNIQRIVHNSMHNAYHYGLSQPTEWINISTKQQRTKLLVDRITNPLDTTETDTDTEIVTISSSLRYDKIMIFVNSLDDVDNVCTALSRATTTSTDNTDSTTGTTTNIPTINPIPYHAKMSLDDRVNALNEFRKYTPPSQVASINDDDTINTTTTPISVLVCTDLASRGLDISDVTCVVQLQFATNAVTHLHRMGRCGRAGQRVGKGIIFYDNTNDSEYTLAKTIQHAESQAISSSNNNNNNSQRVVLQSNSIDYDSDSDNENENEKESFMQESDGKIENAFSRKRGLTKKRKKVRRQIENVQE